MPVLEVNAGLALYTIAVEHGDFDRFDDVDRLGGEAVRLGEALGNRDVTDDADRHFAIAIDLEERCGVRGFLAHTRQERAWSSYWNRAGAATE